MLLPQCCWVGAYSESFSIIFSSSSARCLIGSVSLRIHVGSQYQCQTTDTLSMCRRAPLPTRWSKPPGSSFSLASGVPRNITSIFTGFRQVRAGLAINSCAVQDILFNISIRSVRVPIPLSSADGAFGSVTRLVLPPQEYLGPLGQRLMYLTLKLIVRLNHSIVDNCTADAVQVISPAFGCGRSSLVAR
jgi:hypothetical protein